MHKYASACGELQHFTIYFGNSILSCIQKISSSLLLKHLSKVMETFKNDINVSNRGLLHTCQNASASWKESTDIYWLQKAVMSNYNGPTNHL